MLKVVSAALLAVLCASLFSVYMPLANAQEDDYDCRRYFTGGPGIVQPPEWEYDLLYRWTLDIDDQKYDIRYGGSVKNATANIDRHSIELDGRSEGTILQLRLPRVLIDSTQDGKDVPFTVLVNGQPSLNATQGVVPSNGDRMICIPLNYWGPVARIEIIGTSIAPEFDSLAIVIASVMAVAIVASRAISAKHSTMPKLQVLAQPLTNMLEALIAQIPCEQPACNAISAAVIVAYAAAVTAAIVAIIYFFRKRASDRSLH